MKGSLGSDSVLDWTRLRRERGSLTLAGIVVRSGTGQTRV